MKIQRPRSLATPRASARGAALKRPTALANPGGPLAHAAPAEMPRDRCSRARMRECLPISAVLVSGDF